MILRCIIFGITWAVIDDSASCVIDIGIDVIIKVRSSAFNRFLGIIISTRLSLSELCISRLNSLVTSSKFTRLTSKFAVHSIKKRLLSTATGNENFSPVFSAIGTPNDEGIVIINRKIFKFIEKS